MAIAANPDHQPHPTRRTIVKGAAWATPVIAVAIATPAAAASPDEGGPVPNTEANYYWNRSADADFVTLDPAGSGNRAQFSAQISYRSEPVWVNPPAAGILTVTATFNRPVTVANLGGQWELQNDSPGPAETFTFHITPSSFGYALTFDTVAATSSQLTVTAYMSVLNGERPDGSQATWAEEPGTATTTVVP